ncbi:butyrate kinase [Proteocatella sphenisci]|uniref:butyrate kinase n=1 Tax=Proteocatella sphenisci TaxID=181070 RepID=UPI000491F978|nr:butyrate kinase [Proteocatella sphenisci]
MKEYKILAINPGSTSTKIAVFSNENLIMEKTLRHSIEEIQKYESVFAQKSFRKEVIIESLVEAGISPHSFDAIVGRGGLLKPMEGGTYEVNQQMIEDLANGERGEHASNLGGIIAKEIAEMAVVPAFIVDPVVVDEMDDIARVSGIPEIDRISIFHALNQKAVARRFAKSIGKNYEDINVVVAHLGGGISVGAHKKGKVVDVNNALDGDGAFSPERAGSLPSGQLINMCYDEKYTKDYLKKRIKGNGGLVAYLNTNDAREVEEMIKNGNQKAALVYEAMAYQVAKDIGSSVAVLSCDVDAIILTGGIAYSEMTTDWIKNRVNKMAEVVIYPGEDEMIALAEGALRVLYKEEEAKDYI